MVSGNETINNLLAEIAEISGFLWQKGWAERNGGNISINLGNGFFSDDVVLNQGNQIPSVKLNQTYSALSGLSFYLTGTGERMRDVAKNPLKHGLVLRISENGDHYVRIAGDTSAPTSELPSHLSIHQRFMQTGSSHKVVLHTHPTELIAFTHHPYFREPGNLSRLLWAMIPETRVFVPKGIIVVPYLLTGTRELADATIRALETHDVIAWEKHGVLATGKNLSDCFDMIDTLTKSVLIYLAARSAGFEPEGLSQDQLEELRMAFHLP